MLALIQRQFSLIEEQKTQGKDQTPVLCFEPSNEQSVWLSLCGQWFKWAEPAFMPLDSHYCHCTRCLLCIASWEPTLHCILGSSHSVAIIHGLLFSATGWPIQNNTSEDNTGSDILQCSVALKTHKNNLCLMFLKSETCYFKWYIRDIDAPPPI